MQIIGIERTENPTKTQEFLNKLKQHLSSFPDKIIFKKLISNYGLCKKTLIGVTTEVIISLVQPKERFDYTIVHEVVHAEGYHYHNRKFWRRFIHLCGKVNLDAEYYFKVCKWKQGKNYYAIYKERSSINLAQTNERSGTMAKSEMTSYQAGTIYRLCKTDVRPLYKKISEPEAVKIIEQLRKGEKVDFNKYGTGWIYEGGEKKKIEKAKSVPAEEKAEPKKKKFKSKCLYDSPIPNGTKTLETDKNGYYERIIVKKARK